MPNLYRRGKYWWCWGYDAERQRWLQSTKQVSRRAAERVARRIELEHGERVRTAFLPLEEVLAFRLQHAAFKKRRPKTLNNIRERIAVLLRHFGPQRDVHELTEDSVRAFVMTRRKQAGARAGQCIQEATIHKELESLRKALRLCKKAGLYQNDPDTVVPIDILENPNQARRRRWLPYEEYKRLLACLDMDRRDYVVMWCQTGMRRSELYAVQPHDIDFERKELRVRGTKTDGAERTIPLTEAAMSVLRRRALSPPMFPEWTNNNRDLLRACQRAGLERISLNDLRRTFASWLANARDPASERACAELMGHTDSRMLRKVYSQISDETKRRAIRSLPSLGPAKPATVRSLRPKRSRRS